MSEKNRFGLSRDIPEPTKRQIRQECGFGCVICGKLPYDYEHFEPPFIDAKTHDPAGIALLCPTCHREKTAGRMKLDLLRRARMTPWNSKHDASWITRFGIVAPTLVFAGNTIKLTKNIPIVEINGEVIFGIHPPVEPNGPLGLEGTFCDKERRATLRFRDNEIIVCRGLWDATLEGNALIIRSNRSEISVKLAIEPEASLIVIEQLSMSLATGYSFDGYRDELILHIPGYNINLANNYVEGSNGFLSINEPSFGTWKDWVINADRLTK